MQNKKIKHISESKIYKKAIEVFALTRHIASYITYDKDVLSMHQSTRMIDRYADNLVMNSLALAPKIAEIENEKNLPIKLQLAHSFENIVATINRDCVYLQDTKMSGKDYITLLKKEIKKLQLLHKSYVNAIIEA